uniref:Heat shock protein 70 n=1 Tax=Meloidogyne incognita TaxID=6306 RepID=A0A914KU62_MELIC
MVQEAEKYRGEDEIQRERVSANNGLEAYCFNIKQTMEDDKLKDKISEDDKKKVLDKCQETLSWLDANQTADMRRKNLSIIKRNWKLFAIRSFRSLTALTSSNQWMIGFDFEGIKAGIRCLGVALFGQAWVVCSIPFILSFRFFFFSFLSFIAFRSSLVKNFFLLFETFEGFLSCSRNKAAYSLLPLAKFLRSCSSNSLNKLTWCSLLTLVLHDVPLIQSCESTLEPSFTKLTNTVWLLSRLHVQSNVQCFQSNFMRQIKGAMYIVLHFSTMKSM